MKNLTRRKQFSNVAASQSLQALYPIGRLGVHIPLKIEDVLLQALNGLLLLDHDLIELIDKLILMGKSDL